MTHIFSLPCFFLFFNLIAQVTPATATSQSADSELEPALSVDADGAIVLQTGNGARLTLAGNKPDSDESSSTHMYSVGLCRGPQVEFGE